MVITIGSMLEEVQLLYQQHNQSCFLYLSSEVIKVFFIFLHGIICCSLPVFSTYVCIYLQMFGSDPSCANYLRSLIEALFIHTTKLLRTIQVLVVLITFYY